MKYIFKRKQIRRIGNMVLSVFILLMSLSECITYAQGLDKNKMTESQIVALYKNLLQKNGFVSEEQENIYDLNEGVLLGVQQDKTYGLQNDCGPKTYVGVAAYVQNDDEDVLEDAYTFVREAVAAGMTEELKNTKLMGFTITVNYDYYYPSYNGYQDPYYKHGTVRVDVRSNQMITSLGNFECVYVSRGIECDESGHWNGNFIETRSRLSKKLLREGESMENASGDNGNPYIAKQSSSVAYGCAFSGVAYRFTFGNNEYTNAKVILYDETWNFPDLEGFDWGIGG